MSLFQFKGSRQEVKKRSNVKWVDANSGGFQRQQNDFQRKLAKYLDSKRKAVDTELNLKEEDSPGEIMQKLLNAKQNQRLF